MGVVTELIDRSDELQIEVSTTSAGATVIDMGLEVPGSWEAGRLYAEATMGGLAAVAFGEFELSDETLRSVEVRTEYPVEACWVAQKHADHRAGDPDDVILAGPAKALLWPPDPSVAEAGYVEQHRQAVAPLQIERPVNDSDISWLSQSCGLDPKDVFVLVAPTTSLVCAIQVAARSVDNAMHRMHSAGIELFEVKSLEGSAPVPPPSTDELVALGRINDSLMYGTTVNTIVRSVVDFNVVAEEVTTQPADSAGRLFLEIFDAAGNRFHNVPLEVFCISMFTIADPTLGMSVSVGAIDHDLLWTSFYGTST
jgi:methenyltetrahydromethanopterin cyclohydrolase|tara:strand:+ start:21702 stop:22634 length:933 start_codon:yes stop_codon:yes gene_type:complete